MRSFALLLIKLYQKFFTLIGYGSCRYYPTCSQYAKEQLLHNSFLKAIFYSFMRILKCNQLFDGGIDYPIVKRRFVFTPLLTIKHSHNYAISFWFVPKNRESFYVVRALKLSKQKGIS